MIFERLAHLFQDVPREFRHLVEEQHSVVSEADFARARNTRAASDQPGIGNRMMGRPERALPE